MSSNATTPTGAAGGDGTGAPGGPGGPRGPSPDEVVVYWLDIALLCVLAAFFLAFLPRAVGRLSSSTEWTRGLIFRSVPAPDPMIQHITPNERLYHVTTMTSLGDGASDNSHTLANHNAYVRSDKALTTSSSGCGDTTHIRSLSTVLHPVSKLFTHPLSGNKTTGKLFLMLGYIGVIAFVALNDNDPILGPDRLGYIAISQIPVVIALGTKNNVVGMLLGMGYERVRPFVDIHNDDVLTSVALKAELLASSSWSSGVFHSETSRDYLQ